MDNQYEHLSEAGKMALLAKIYEQNMNRLSEKIGRDFEAETLQYKNEMTAFVKENIKNGLDSVLKAYVEEMDGARERMIGQTKEFNAYLHEVNRKNRQLAQRSWIITTACLAALSVGMIGAGWYAFSLKEDIQARKQELSVLELFDRADIVRCGDHLCAKTSSANNNGYRVIKLK